MSLEMAHKVIVPQKKIISRSFLNSGTLIVIRGLSDFRYAFRKPLYLETLKFIADLLLLVTIPDTIPF